MFDQIEQEKAKFGVKLLKCSICNGAYPSVSTLLNQGVTRRDFVIDRALDVQNGFGEVTPSLNWIVI